MIVQWVHYVKSVYPSHLRVIGLFTGGERTFPREHCQQNSLDNLSKLQFQPQSLQLQKVSDNLFRANKYLAPKDSKTWNYLLNRQRDQSSDLDLDFQPVESDAESSNSLDPDITAPESPEHDLDSLNDQPSDTPALSRLNFTYFCKTISQPHN